MENQLAPSYYAVATVAYSVNILEDYRSNRDTVTKKIFDLVSFIHMYSSNVFPYSDSESKLTSHFVVLKKHCSILNAPIESMALDSS